MPTTIAGGQRRLLFTGNVKTSLFNKYTPGSGVGALNTSVRRHLQRKASAATIPYEELSQYNTSGLVPTFYAKGPCCPEITSNPSNKAFPYPTM